MTTIQKTELLTGQLPPSVLADLAEAKRTLETRGIADRLTELIGTPILASVRLLPGFAESALNAAVTKSLELALQAAVRSLGPSAGPGRPRVTLHKWLAGLSGGLGGALGGATVAAELPFSTILILRSVADIARSEGEDLSDLQTQLACLEVFSLAPGQPVKADDATEIGYFAVRAAMAKQIADASKYLLQNQVISTTAPPLTRLISEIGKRFGITVSQKVAAQAIPVIGAVGGALINSYFIDHYQDLARAHFLIRRLEREYGQSLVEESYHAIQLDARPSK